MFPTSPTGAPGAGYDPAIFGPVDPFNGTPDSSGPGLNPGDPFSGIGGGGEGSDIFGNPGDPISPFVGGGDAPVTNPFSGDGIGGEGADFPDNPDGTNPFNPGAGGSSAGTGTGQRGDRLPTVLRPGSAISQLYTRRRKMATGVRGNLFYKGRHKGLGGFTATILRGF